jgi:hypothetical protein
MEVVRPIRLGFVLAVLVTPASAGERDSAGLPAGVTCEQVRATVAQIGKVKALALAIEHGATLQQVRAGRRCLISNDVVVASGRG